ncbi:MAG: putative baseplate assembly protein [bacterium]|nr:putative baseplate assembly protein [bacterium]
MALTAPPIDRREQEQLAAKLREFLVQYVDEFTDVDQVQANAQLETIVQLFGRLHEVINDRLNRAPDRNFLTFLELVGVDISPPKSAAAPLVFVPGDRASGDILVPAGTPVIVEGSEDDPITFETREDLTVVRSTLSRIVSIDPVADRFTDHASLLDDESELVETLLAGRTPLTHRIYFGHDALFDLQDAATLRILTEQPFAYGFAPDVWSVNWYKYNAAGELEALTPLAREDAEGAAIDARVNNLLEGGSVEFELIEAIEAAPVGGFSRGASGANPQWPELSAEKRWIVAELSTSIPTESYSKALGLQPDFIYFNNSENLTGESFFPFGEDPEIGDASVFGDAEILGNAGATIVMNFDLAAPNIPALAPGGVRIQWQYLIDNGWQDIGLSDSDGVISGDYNLVDETVAFTQSGQVRFFCPEIPLSTFRSQDGRWIRARVESGGYEDGPGSPDGPEAITFSMGHSYVPELNRIRAQIEISPPEPKQADAAFSGAQLLDISKDFFPFGKKPEFNATFYFALKDAFSNAGTLVDLQVALSSGFPAPDTTAVELSFEFFDGFTWKELGTTTEAGVATPTGVYSFVDTSNAFTQSGSVQFVCPPVEQATVNGREDYFLRVRITGGDYGREAFFDNVNSVLIPATFQPPSLASFLIDYAFLNTDDPEQILLENEFFFRDSTAQFTETSTGSVSPITAFEISADEDPALYLGFDQELSSVPVSLFFPILPAPFQLTDTGAPPTILWEYWDGTEWQVATFNDDTQGLTRKDLAQVLVPGNSQERPLFGTNRNWVRLRLASGEFVTKPEVSSLHLNAVWSDNLITTRDELLGSSNAEPDQIFRVSQNPVIDGQQIEVRETALTAEDRAKIIEEEGDDAVREVVDEAGNVTDIWLRWHQVLRFEASDPQSRHYIFDALTGEIRFGNGARGFIPPAGRNNIVARFYQFGGGSRGNVSAKSITKPRSALVGIDSVFNPELVAGGVDLESLDRLRERGPRAIKNRGRAVTLDDYEALTIESTGEIARVRALATTDPALQFAPGWVTVLIVPQSDDPRPVPSQELIRFVADYLRARSASHIAGTLPSQVNVVPPGYLRVFAEVDVAYKNINEARIVQSRINETLTEFFNPLRGGPKGTGWDFGRNVYGTEVYQLVENVEGVDFVDSVILRASEQILYAFPQTPFRALAGYPAGSEIEFIRATPGGTRRASYLIGEKIVEDEQTDRITVLGVKEGDVITLQTGATQNNFPINLVVESVANDSLRINPDFAQVTYPVGSVISSADGRLRTTLLQEIPVGVFEGLTVMIPEAGDDYQLRFENLAQINGEVASVSDEVEVIILDENNLTYSGTHVIRALQQDATG